MDLIRVLVLRAFQLGLILILHLDAMIDHDAEILLIICRFQKTFIGV